MPGHGIHANLHGVVRRLPQEVAKFLTSQDWFFGNTAETNPRLQAAAADRTVRVAPLDGRGRRGLVGHARLVSERGGRRRRPMPAWPIGRPKRRFLHWQIAGARRGCQTSMTGSSSSTRPRLAASTRWPIRRACWSAAAFSSKSFEGLGLTGMVLAEAPARRWTPSRLI